MVSEHIIIADELYDHAIEPTRVTREESITNRVNGIVTKLSFYEEGCLRVRQSYKGKSTSEHLLELRFLNPSAQASRRSAMQSLLLALGLGLVATLAAFILPETTYSAWTLSITAATATLALLALLLHIYRRQVRYRFVTANGEAAVLTLSGSFGCMRRTRAAVRMIRDAIASARNGQPVQDIDHLRAEMKAHYKMAEAGVISREACADGTRLILAKFNH
jgi:hypothetical protein